MRGGNVYDKTRESPIRAFLHVASQSIRKPRAREYRVYIRPCRGEMPGIALLKRRDEATLSQQLYNIVREGDQESSSVDSIVFLHLDRARSMSSAAAVPVYVRISLGAPRARVRNCAMSFEDHRRQTAAPSCSTTLSCSIELMIALLTPQYRKIAKLKL